MVRFMGDLGFCYCSFKEWGSSPLRIGIWIFGSREGSWGNVRHSAELSLSRWKGSEMDGGALKLSSGERRGPGKREQALPKGEAHEVWNGEQ